MKLIIPSLVLALCSIASAFGATYYIDFAGGNDQADGRSPQTAWKHSPGDKKATSNPAATELQPGDILHFKGGVTYVGEISIKASGTEGSPIIIDGNTDGSFGEGRAIFDGAQMITDWKKVTSAEQVDGNPRWKEIMYADLDVDLSSSFNQDSFVLHRERKVEKQAPWQRLFLIDGEHRVLPIAQQPKPTDPFYPDLPDDFYDTPNQLQTSYPHKIYYEKGSKGNRRLPLMPITYGGAAPVIEPLDGGTISLDLAKPERIAEIGIKLHRPKTMTAPKEVVFLADDKKVYTAKIDPKDSEMQRFKLPRPVEASKLSFQLKNDDPKAPKWTKLQQVAAYTPDGVNVIQQDSVTTILEDKERLTQKDPNWYDGMFVGVRGGNNHVYFARVTSYDPNKSQIHAPHFTSRIYDNTQYAFYNSPKFLELPGEWCLEPLDGNRSRVYFLPEELVDGQPVNIGYPVLKTAITLSDGISHIEVRGFLVQRYSAGNGGVATMGRGNAKTSHIRIADCEVRFMSGPAGININYSEHVTIENCYVHHCPGWTVGIYINRVDHYRLSGNRLDTNSGSGIRHYDGDHGVLENNVVLNHYGMHSSGLNFYEGCSNIVFEGNFVQNVIAINRSAENLTFRNNVVDSENKNPVSVAMWPSGRLGGRFMKNLLFENNTFVNVDPDVPWSTSVFVQSGASPPEGLVIRNNVIEYLRSKVPGTIEDNIFMKKADRSVADTGSIVVSDPNKLFRDPANNDYRRKPGGPMMDAGANVPPPAAAWKP